MPSTITIPTGSMSFNQDFCVSPLAPFKDLAINLFPTTVARPGFNSQYKLIYSNNGTAPSSGTVHLYFDNTRLVFLDSSVPTDEQSAGIIS